MISIYSSEILFLPHVPCNFTYLKITENINNEWHHFPKWPDVVHAVATALLSDKHAFSLHERQWRCHVTRMELRFCFQFHSPTSWTWKKSSFNRHNEGVVILDRSMLTYTVHVIYKTDIDEISLPSQCHKLHEQGNSLTNTNELLRYGNNMKFYSK